MRLTIRRFRPDEAALLRGIRLEALKLSPETFGRAYEDEARQDEAFFAARLAAAAVWGVFDGEAPVGMASLERHDGVKKWHKATLGGMYLAPVARGSGVAARLIETILDHARAKGIEQVLLTCMATNARARSLYERMGFAQFGLEPRALKADGKYFDDVHMVRRL